MLWLLSSSRVGKLTVQCKGQRYRWSPCSHQGTAGRFWWCNGREKTCKCVLNLDGIAEGTLAFACKFGKTLEHPPADLPPVNIKNAAPKVKRKRNNFASVWDELVMAGLYGAYTSGAECWPRWWQWKRVWIWRVTLGGQGIIGI